MNFQLFEAHDVDIENFNQDIEDLANNLFVGPQGELLEDMDQFNYNYNGNIGVTKNFTLKPGGYDEIKTMHANYVLRYDMKPRGIGSIFQRMSDYQWRLANFKTQLLRIEQKMKDLKASGIRWQDNTDQIGSELDRVKSNIINGLNTARQIIPECDIKCHVMPTIKTRADFIRDRGRTYNTDRFMFPQHLMFDIDNIPVKDYMIVYYIKIPNLQMKVHVLDGQTLDEYTVPMGDVIIASGTYLLPLVSRNWGREETINSPVPLSTYTWFLEAIYLDHVDNQHPYIGSVDNKYAFNLGQDINSANICTGNMQQDLRNSILNNDSLAHIYNLYNWVTNYYVPQTNPLNQISRARSFGSDVSFSQYRADLNTTSSRVFRSYAIDNKEIHLPHDCDVSRNYIRNAKDYATNSNHGYWSANRVRYTDEDEVYGERLSDFYQEIDLKDFPCNNCIHSNDCEQWDNINVTLNESLSPEMEGYIGALYEIQDLNRNIISRVVSRQSYRPLVIAEEALGASDWPSLMTAYDKLYLAYQIMKFWIAKHENIQVDYTDIEFVRRFKRLHNLSLRALLHLNANHCNDNSTFEWTINQVENYHVALEDSEDTYQEYMQSIDNQQAVRSFINHVDNPVFEAHDVVLESDRIEQIRNMRRRAQEIVDRARENQSAQESPTNDELTAEQRTIQWAINNGGANNL
jgi:hypothetical protein